VPRQSRWLSLRAELQAEDGCRVWLSNENLSEEPEEILRSLLGEIGGSPLVVLTMRSLPAQLASAWQQYLKSGVYISFETWLRRVIGDKPHPKTTPSFNVRTNLTAVVEKWVRLVGRDQVVVIILDPQDRTLVPRTFEHLLGLPFGTLSAEFEGQDTNRSMTFPEAELVRRTNTVVRQLDDVDWRDYERYLRDGAIEAMLSRRRPGPDEQRIVPPKWAVARAAALGEQHAQGIDAAGVRVLGRLDDLAVPVPAVDHVRAPDDIPLDAAAEALLAVLSTGLGRGRAFGPPPRPPAARPRIEDVPTSTIMRLLVQRMKRRIVTATQS